MYSNILVPTDGLAHTERAIAEGIDLASEHDAVLHTLYVINSAAVAPGIDFDDLEEIGHQAVGYVVDQAESAGIESTAATVRHGLRDRAILDYVADHEIDLIVIGRHKRWPMNQLLRGGVSDQIMEETDIPVLVFGP